MSKDYKVKYKDVYIFSNITQYILGQELVHNIDTPFRNENDITINVCLRGNSIIGYGRRQWQRDELERTRGMVISLETSSESKLVGIYNSHKEMVEMFRTVTLGDIKDGIVNDIISHLEYNNVNIEISSDEAKRVKLEKRWKAGDRVQREAGRSGYRDESDYTDDE